MNKRHFKNYLVNILKVFFFHVHPSEHNYTESCTSTSDCDTTIGLFCQTTSGACNCPNISVTGMCDCFSEYYFSHLDGKCGKKIYLL